MRVGALAAAAVLLVGIAVVVRHRTSTPTAVTGPPVGDATSTTLNASPTPGAPVEASTPLQAGARTDGTDATTTVASTTSSPTRPTTTAVASPGQDRYLVARSAREVGSATGVDPDRVETWPVIGVFDEDPSLVVIGIGDAFGTLHVPCIGIRDRAAPAAAGRTICYGAAGAIQIGDRLAWLAAVPAGASEASVPTAPLFKAPGFAWPGTPPSPEVAHIAAVVARPNDDIYGDVPSADSPCGYRQIFAALPTPVSLGGLHCVAAAAVVGHGLDSAQPDSAYFERIDGSWRLVASGGDPCLLVGTTIDPSNVDPATASSLPEFERRLEQVCRALGEVQ